MRLTAALPFLAILLAGCATPPQGAPDPTALPGGCPEISLTLEQRKEGGLEAYDLIAVNDGDAACTLSGYPVVEVLAPGGEEVMAVSPTPMDTVEAVALEPGDEAYTVIEFERGDVACDSADTGGLRITLPGSTESVTIEEPPVTFCSGGDEVRVGSFASQRLEGEPIKPDSDPDY